MVLTGMKKISVLTALGMLMIAPWGMAQTIYDGAKLTGKDLNGTARFVGMGGAMGALGGDISTMYSFCRLMSAIPKFFATSCNSIK